MNDEQLFFGLEIFVSILFALIAVYRGVTDLKDFDLLMLHRFSLRCRDRVTRWWRRPAIVLSLIGFIWFCYFGWDFSLTNTEAPLWMNGCIIMLAEIVMLISAYCAFFFVATTAENIEDFWYDLIALKRFLSFQKNHCLTGKQEN